MKQVKNGLVMNKPSIYFSKSKAGDTKKIAEAKGILETFDIDLLECTGTFDPLKLHDADYLLILPPGAPENRDDDYGVWIGRGQYEELSLFLEDNYDCNVKIIIDGINRNISNISSLEIDGISSIDVTKENWKTKYAFLTLDDDIYNIEDEFPSMKKKKTELADLPDLNLITMYEEYNQSDLWPDLSQILPSEPINDPIVINTSTNNPRIKLRLFAIARLR